MNIQEFLEKHKFVLEYKALKVMGRPDMDDNSWAKDASHYQIRIKRIGQGAQPAFIAFYSQGSAHKGPPKFDSVLESLAMDSSAAYETFKDFCDNCGYSSDSIKALETYNVCVSQTESLKKALGAPIFQELLEVEWQ